MPSTSASPSNALFSSAAGPTLSRFREHATAEPTGSKPNLIEHRVPVEAGDTPFQITLSRDRGFSFIVRNDAEHVVALLTARLAETKGVDPAVLQQVVAGEYERFMQRCFENLSNGLTLRDPFAESASDPERSVDIHFLQARDLVGSVACSCNGHETVSLDPLFTGARHSLEVSRLYCVGGQFYLHLNARPFSPSLETQIAMLKERLGDRPLVLVDDDIYTGGTIAEVVTMLGKEVPVVAVHPQMQTGEPRVLSQLGIAVRPAVKFTIEDGKRVDIGDVRDFLPGCCGLVVKLPSGHLGRAPYMLPFVSPNARASIPVEQEVSFSQNMLLASFDFYERVGRAIGSDILVRDVDPSFANLAQELFMIPPSMPMTALLHWAATNTTEAWRNVRSLGETQRVVEKLNLPKKLVLLDVNGTIYPEDALTPNLDDRLVDQMRAEVARLHDLGIEVGLCSDSPLPQLQQLSRKLGLTGPIVAENGSVIAWQDEQAVLGGLSAERVADIKAEIQSLVPAGYRQEADIISPEFGGTLLDCSAGRWAFGANRSTTITLFGDAELIQAVARRFNETQGICVDADPEHNFLAVHPGSDHRSCKGRTLATLSQFGIDIVMVGNSMSDWVDPSSRVKCAFVGDSRITDRTQELAGFVSHKPTLEGVIEILQALKPANDAV